MIEKLFQLKKNNTNIKNEVIAGIITFLTCLYTIFVVPVILSEAGIDIHKAFISTCLVIFISCTILALTTNLPFMVGPGLSLNTIFVYDIIINGGHSYNTALLVVIISSLLSFIVFLIMPIKYLIDSIPKSLRTGVVGGSGIFLIIIGLKLTGIIIPNINTLSSLGNIYSIPFLFTFIFILILIISYHKNTNLFAMLTLVCFVLTTIVNLIINANQGYLEEILKLVNYKNYSFPFFTPDFSYFKLSLIGVIIALFFAGNFDSLGTYLIYKNSCKENNIQPKEETEENKILKRFFIFKAISSMISGLLGSTAITVFLESSSGIKSGGKTGLVGLTIGILFLLSLLLKPLLSIIPNWSSGAILISIGLFIIVSSLSTLAWKEPTDYFPAILALLFIPLTYSITIGIAIGIISYILIKILSGKIRDINILTFILGIIFVIYLIQ